MQKKKKNVKKMIKAKNGKLAFTTLTLKNV